MAEERRTLAIEARVRDFATKTLTRIQSTVKRVAGGIVSAFTRAVSSVFSLRGAFVALLGVFAVSRIIAFINNLREGLDELAKTSDRIGVTTESPTAMQFAGELAGVSLKELTNAARDFSRNVENARRGARLQADALAALGLSAQEFTGGQIDLTDVLARVSDRLKLLRDQTQRTDILMNLFGRSGVQLGALLAQGSEGIRKAAQEAERLGLVFSREELARVERFNDAVTRLQRVITSFFQRVIIELSPLLEGIFDRLVEQLGGTQEAAKKTAEVLVNVAEEIAIVFLRANEFVQKSGSVIGRTLAGIGGAAVAGTAAVKAFFGNDTQENQKEFAEGLADVLKAYTGIGREVDETTGKVEAQIASVQKFFAEIRAGRAETKKEPVLVDSTVVEGDRPGLFEGLLQGAAQAADRLTDVFEQAKQAGSQLVTGTFSSLEDSLTNIVTGAQSAKEAFRQFGIQTLALLARLAIRLALVSILSRLLPGFNFKADGGVIGPDGTDLPLQKFAAGGVARRPTLALFGEGRNAEAFVPLPDNRTIPVTLTGGGGEGAGVVQITINAMDSRDVQRVFLENNGLLRTIWANSIETRVSSRHSVRRAVS